MTFSVLVRDSLFLAIFLSVTYGNDVFDNSHFLIKDDSDVPSGTLNTWVVSMVGRGR